jgi:hypothetical protein
MSSHTSYLFSWHWHVKLFMSLGIILIWISYSALKLCPRMKWAFSWLDCTLIGLLIAPILCSTKCLPWFLSLLKCLWLLSIRMWLIEWWKHGS